MNLPAASGRGINRILFYTRPKGTGNYAQQRLNKFLKQATVFGGSTAGRVQNFELDKIRMVFEIVLDSRRVNYFSDFTDFSLYRE